MIQPQGRARAAADVGGTFIDFVALDTTTGEVFFEKQPSTSGRLVDEFIAGLHRIGISGDSLEQLFHGTTVAINAVVQERGARVALVTTAGFRDVLEIGRGGRKEIYNLHYSEPPPLVARDLRFEITERMSAAGDVLVPLATDELDPLAESLRAAQVEAVAVCFLHAYANSQHEQAVGEALGAALPGVPITTSHDVTREWREYERTSSAVINAYVQPIFGQYVAELTERLTAEGYTAPLGIMQSNGGVLAAERAAVVPLKTLMSGPAGGVVGSRELARESGIRNAICADVGGTTFDVALIIDGDLVEDAETSLNGRPVLGNMVGIRSVGAGGGSIAWLDSRNALKVGPASAGAVPGPVCFRQAGTEPTVTDAQLVLGRLDAEAFLGGRMNLDRDAAEQAIAERVAGPLGLDIASAALGILRIAETNMTNAMRAITIGRGLDPRDFSMISYGGGGGLFAALTAEELGMTHVIAPRAAPYFSAWGILSSDYYEDTTRTRIIPVHDSALPEIRGQFEELAAEAVAGMRSYGFDERLVEVRHSADIRFIGQHHTVSVPIESEWLQWPSGFAERVRADFIALHDRMYGPRTRNNEVEMVSLRTRGEVATEKPKLPKLADRPDGAPRGERSVRFAGAAVATALYDRDELAPGQRIDGPAIVEEWANTTLVPPNWSVEVDNAGHFHMTLSTRETPSGGGR